MAGVHFVMSTAENALVALAAETIIELTAASNHRCLIHEISLSFDGIAVGNQPVLVEEVRITVTATGTGGTASKRDADYSESIQTSFKHTITVEPTLTVMKRWNVHPQTGVIIPLPITRPIPISGGGMWGLRFTAANAVNVTVNIEAEE